jgi:ferritin-like metal-binding protein YciE
MALKNLEDGLVEELTDILSAENQIAQLLPKMAEKTSNAKLKSAFEMHARQTEEHISRVEEALTMLGQKPEAKTCEAMKGLAKEGQSIMKEDAEPEVLDAMLIAAAQKIEHYEIASYGTVCTWAAAIGRDDVKELLGKTLQNEEQTDKKLSELAESTVNKKAVD